MKVYFIGEKRELPPKHKARAVAIFTSRWMDGIRAAEHGPVSISTYNPNHVHGIVRATSGRNWTANLVILKNEKDKKRPPLYTLVIQR